VDAADRIWLSYVTEVARVDQRGVRVFLPADGLDVGPVLALRSHGSTLWVGAEMGLAFEKQDRFHVVRTDGDQNFGAVADIVSTADGLWLNTAAGIVHIRDSEITRVTSDPSHRVRYDLFDLVSDLPEPLLARRRYLAATQGQNGTVWFVTNNGIARVDPRLIVRNPVVPPVVIRAVSADDQPFQPRGIVSLPALTRTLRIDYTALSLAIPERVRFRYRLEGWETVWHDAGTRREVFYTDLAPGPYTFRVLAANNDGVWNEEGARLAFTVAPAWFQTTWFRASVVLSLVVGVVGLYRLRVRRVSFALRARYDERLAERTRIARELHDTLLQTVQGSRMVADDALDHASDPEHVRQALTRLTEWLGRAVDEGRAALNSLRASTTETNDLVEALNRAAEDPTKPSAMSVSVVALGQSRDLHPIVRDEIYRIAHEAIRNAYQHSGATRLDISIEYAPGELRLRIADNGGGILPSLVDSGRPGRFGLPGMRERANRIGGSILIASSGSGTSITLTVPGRSAFRTSGH
jgi:signal transduction histidine kinase